MDWTTKTNVVYAKMFCTYDLHNIRKITDDGGVAWLDVVSGVDLADISVLVPEILDIYIGNGIIYFIHTSG